MPTYGESKAYSSPKVFIPLRYLQGYMLTKVNKRIRTFNFINDNDEFSNINSIFTYIVVSMKN